MTRWTSYNKTVPLCFLPGENIQLTIAFWRPGYCLVKPKLTRVQPWFNQTGFYGCETGVTRLYEWVKSLVNQAISGKLSKPGIILKKKNRTVALSRLLKFWIYRANQASNSFCSPGWLLCTVAHCEKAIMVDYSGDEIWGKCRQSLIVYLFSPQISPTKSKKQLPFLVKLLFFSVYSTAVQYFPCLRKHSKTCWKKKLKKNFVKAIASLSCLSGAVLSHFWYVYQHNYINLASLMGFTKPIRHYAESTHVKKKKMIQSHFKKS